MVFFSDSCTFTLKFHRSRIAISGSREKGFQSTEYKISQIPLCIEEQEIKQEVATSLSHADKSQKKAWKIKLAQVVCNGFCGWMLAEILLSVTIGFTRLDGIFTVAKIEWKNTMRSS